ncbi:hypothetical protein [Catalinimonas niigatensis]|uniref:hypothetical protein n=1 Tax=Catalinimonas niigatensis TaxID=1397264 RepID=UPI00266576A2|nr:hypothetical protein [Catalinimonas niigatensis]WPP52767.1 hypothetical protein PZB72_10300 [Catalinimonas niigatensis]
MDSVRIDILNPKAKKLLEDLEALELIAIRKDKNQSFEEVLRRLRKKAASAPSLEEITKEVEAVRSKRYGK